MRLRLLLALAPLVLLLCAACGSAKGGGAAPTHVLFAAGDLVGCHSPGAEETFKLVAKQPRALVATLGDHVYQTGSPALYRGCYARTWGRIAGRDRPTPGDHDYVEPNAPGYFGYFHRVLERFGPTAAKWGYYSYDLGTWHVVVLNSNCGSIGGCDATSAEGRWLSADLARHPARCTLAYWHFPLFNSGFEGNRTEGAYFWQALYESGAEIVLNGHNHAYERFAPQTPDGKPDPRGIREFVVGTGGRSHYLFSKGKLQPNSQVRNDTSFGVLRLKLRPGSYSWKFLPAGGGTFTDAGTGNCH